MAPWQISPEPYSANASYLKADTCSLFVSIENKKKIPLTCLPRPHDTIFTPLFSPKSSRCFT
ncbi:hypothetical protein BpHYR1_003145 [Brachionus plicatilis]|uniref:Uncharacterized protein n=1 Tax=Brachionus plicatilis TaxID=10195 RepID=A0A3M7QAV4_BRAPC|nr:hypothetical protein BpHYR1_003145 [Brachionus plicatilis]